MLPNFLVSGDPWKPRGCGHDDLRARQYTQRPFSRGLGAGVTSTALRQILYKHFRLQFYIFIAIATAQMVVAGGDGLGTHACRSRFAESEHLRSLRGRKVAGAGGLHYSPNLSPTLRARVPTPHLNIQLSKASGAGRPSGKRSRAGNCIDMF